MSAEHLLAALGNLACALSIPIPTDQELATLEACAAAYPRSMAADHPEDAEAINDIHEITDAIREATRIRRINRERNEQDFRFLCALTTGTPIDELPPLAEDRIPIDISLSCGFELHQEGWRNPFKDMNRELLEELQRQYLQRYPPGDPNSPLA
ncbi:hypothetical protein ADJ76_01675 [Schaalia meyeri]|uniref:Uncharacterized protein n=1 Tax=Schaalia meyeri TaxID=52773 RepID=A0AAQ0BV96_9ACTO|nr:hypothetical protein [Schaalia meyeri]AKU64650.1 hypothetical protein ADJ76_01675 [Schaalia meyeri]OFQ23895.1 hypothetical protein HMPREF2946_02375 [Actinomyces sp. HMSC062G12]QQC43134.1 hypothetical protein I6H42_04765 [Schaalia meyeri]SDS09111.1 hypothetical protein SAMN04489715_1627 [Schaalia meyeri]